MEENKNGEAYKAILEISQQKESLKAKESFWKAYLWSVLIPPVGIYFFIKYFFFGDASYERRKAAVVSLVLTVISLVVNVWLIQLFFSQSLSGNSQNLDTLKEIITPENQNNLQQLLQ